VGVGCFVGVNTTAVKVAGIVVGVDGTTVAVTIIPSTLIGVGVDTD
jgi:hypothetical protein